MGKRRVLAAIAVVYCAAVSMATATPRGDHAKFQTDMKAGADALAKKDFAAAKRDYSDALKLAPQHPTAIYRLALTNASTGNAKDAFAFLHRIAAMGLQMPANFETSFAMLKNNIEFATVKMEIARNTAALCNCNTVFDGPRQSFIAEGIAFDPRGNRLLVSSVYQRKIVAIENGRMHDFSATLPAGLSPFSITLDPKRGRIWVSAASLPQSHGATAVQRGHSALLAFDMRGKLIANIAGPKDTDLGDTALAPDGTVYVTDSRNGGVYRLKPDAAKFEAVPNGLSSAQGIAIRAENRTALFADYALGLMRLDLATGRLTAIAVPDSVTTLGIDGPAPVPDGSFAATQNGIAPARVVRFRLSRDWSRITRFDVIARNAPPISDPSLLTVSGKNIYVVGVAQWASFDHDKTEPARPVPAFKIVKLALP